MSNRRSTVRSVLKSMRYRGRLTGTIAYTLQRVSGIVLFVYLIFHLADLTTLAMGKAAYESLLMFLETPLLLVVSAIILLSVLFHGLNGIRLWAFTLGFGTARQTKLVKLTIVAAVSLAIIAGSIALLFRVIPP